MKKVLTLAVIFLAMIGALFSDQLIPSVGVNPVAAYPVPETPTATAMPTSTPVITPTPHGLNPPYYPDDYIMPKVWNDGQHDRIVVICPSCDSFQPGPIFLEMMIIYNDGISWWQRIGYYAGRTYPNNYPYFVTIPVENQWILLSSGGCFTFKGMYGHVASTRYGDPDFWLDVFLPNGQTDLRVCKSLFPLVIRN